jgi:maltooligosyltrehalose trehalohydrolase
MERSVEIYILIRAVREWLKAKFKAFRWPGEPPDPQAMGTFLRSKLNLDRRRRGRGRVMCEFYRELLHLRREIPALAALGKNSLEVSGREEPRLVFFASIGRREPGLLRHEFRRKEATFNASPLHGDWKKPLDSANEEWAGTSLPLSERIETGQELTAGGRSFASYELAG